jgi:hypothetical protein
MNKNISVIISIFIMMAFTACQLHGAIIPVTSRANGAGSPSISNPELAPTATQTSESAGVVPTVSPQVTQETETNPTEEPSVVNPLTGLPVENPENLLLPPALVSVTNFPPSARPQAGLSFSPMVFELFIGEGMTRYLALFYGDYPHAAIPPQGTENQKPFAVGVDENVVGPVRSGRLPYEYIRRLYNGFIVMASAYSKVAAQLKDFVNVYSDDNMDPNSALMPVSMLEEVAKANQKALGKMNLSGMAFDPQVPQNGKKAQSLWVFYSYKNQIFWRYNADDGSYHRWQDNADGETFTEQTDRLNGNPLTFENVVVMFVDHKVKNTTLIDLDLLYVKREKALLFRDGVMQEIYWTTLSEEYEKTTGLMRPIRFVDAKGNPVSFKPGQTWVEIIPNYDAYWETVNSEKYNQLASGRSKGSGYWGVYFKLDN